MLSIMQISIAMLAFVTISDATNLRQDNRGLREMTYTQTNANAAALLARVNKERAARGLPAFCSNKKLQAAAQRHIQDQSKTDYVSDSGTDNSTPKQRVTAAGYKWQSVDENIDTGSANVNAVVSTWLKSDCRDAILGKYTMVGTAYVYNEKTFNKHYWVQVYATGTSEECDN
ncbi:SCP-like extracellular protein [Phytophthora palmivora]|uniref:SCP-like extracellular protein n=1 Tax=Phytophthora palmivora TaxID=4796 RepID=A0A2P4YIR8_9STRA|nr:SCP-like extracellular protein [Phytophthora palmivora]